jgi:cytochrome c553
MTTFEDARRLAESDPWYSLPDGGAAGINVCAICNRAWEHAVDCPWLMLPKIVAALEAARELVDELPLQTDGAIWTCAFCHGEQFDTLLTDEEPFPHDADCSWQALTRALQGEPA